MLMVASVGSIDQLSDSASFGLGAVTVYLLPGAAVPAARSDWCRPSSPRRTGAASSSWVKDAFGDRTGFQAT